MGSALLKTKAENREEKARFEETKKWNNYWKGVRNDFLVRMLREFYERAGSDAEEEIVRAAKIRIVEETVFRFKKFLARTPRYPGGKVPHCQTFMDGKKEQYAVAGCKVITYFPCVLLSTGRMRARSRRFKWECCADARGI